MLSDSILWTFPEKEQINNLDISAIFYQLKWLIINIKMITTLTLSNRILNSSVNGCINDNACKLLWICSHRKCSVNLSVSAFFLPPTIVTFDKNIVRSIAFKMIIHLLISLLLNLIFCPNFSRSNDLATTIYFETENILAFNLPISTLNSITQKINSTNCLLFFCFRLSWNKISFV